MQRHYAWLPLWIACAVAACGRRADSIVVDWPSEAGVSADSLRVLFRQYLGQSPVGMAGCGPRRVAIAFADVPGDVRHLTTRQGNTVTLAPASVGRARASVAEAAAVLAWAALESSHAIDTLTIGLRSTPNRLSAQFSFVADPASYLHPLRLIDREVAHCALPT
jgi:hypothetical protein